MSIKNKSIINVLNYGDSVVCISTRDNSYEIPRCADDGNPSVTPFTPSEVENANSSSNAFKAGLLRFEEYEQKKVYEEICKIKDWANILTNKEIEDIIINPTIDGLQKILSISNSSIFERVRGIYTRIKNLEKYDVTNRVDRIVTQRYQELVNGKIKTDISLSDKDVARRELAVDVADIKAENSELKNELAEMKKMMEDLLKSKSVNTSFKVDSVQTDADKP